MSGLETFPKAGDANNDDTKTTSISTVETGGNYLKVPGAKSNGSGNGNADAVPTVRIGDGDEDDDDYDPSADVHNTVGNGVTLELSDMEDLEGIMDRDQWGNPLQFFCTILGFCVGLGNIWRFPYLCQAYGGGAFVFPFLIMIVVEGAPLMLLELGLGQRFRKGSYICWNLIHPWLGGIGIGSTIIGTCIGCYYNMIIAWCLYYLLMSIRTTLPWSSCPMEDVELPSQITDGQAINGTSASGTVVSDHPNVTQREVPECADSSETQYYWYRVALDITGDIEDTDGIRWWMLIALIIAWIVVYLVIRKGIASSGKVVYFTALFPYVVLTIFFVRGLTLEGASAGVAHMFTPDLDMLMSPTVWLEAANQVFFSFSLAFGSIIGFGSYNPIDKNCVHDTIAISIANALTALYAGMVIFSILGFKAHHLFVKCMEHDIHKITEVNSTYAQYNASAMTEEEYNDILADLSFDVPGLKNCSMATELNKAAQGTGLAFVVMTDVFTMLPAAPLWSFLFFAMLLCLGLGSQIGILEGVMGTFFDMPQFKNYRKVIVSGCCCLFCFFVGTLFCTGAGEYWLSVIDKYIGMGLSVVAFCEIVAVMYVYGHARFTNDIYEMTGVRPGIFWQVTWRFVAPILVAIIMVSSIIQEMLKKPEYSAWNRETAETEKKEYPAWVLGIAVTLAMCSIAPLAIIAVLRAMKINVLPVDVGSMTKSVATLRRVATDASTRPMMPSVESYHDLPPVKEERA